ncbi:MAG: DMT family transporter [Alphaproteobacteria bacterium]|jgi:drug/metabolite transporter (DMT)-like permease|nr:DMT family transporter [Alphaproteobacteria bacterium]MDP6567358.1 DMT family transporter [Alphaproteobacteria bacterium]MDP6813062.1 DMT family transporter [Alphaproteobacteria bacterium]
MHIPLAAVVVAVIINILWGANPVAVKIALEAFPPLTSAFIRFAIGVVCIALWAAIERTRLWPRRGEWLGLIILAGLFATQIGVMNWGINLTSGADAAVLTATFPLFAALFAHFMIAGDQLSPGKVTGLAIAFVGVGVVLTGGQVPTGLSLADVGNLLMICSALLLGGRMIFTARLVSKIDPTRVVIWQMLLALGAFAAGAATFETIAWDRVGWRPLGALVYQGVVIAGLGFMVNAWLIKRYSPSVVVSFGFISPIFGVLLSNLLLGDRLTWDLAVGTVAVGVGLVVLARQAQRRPEA